MNILFIGDIVGKVGRKAVSDNLSTIKQKYSIDFTIANGENITNGKGISKSHYQFLINEGIDCVTLGNHYQSKSELKSFIPYVDALIRPLNLKEDFPGVGTKVFEVHGIRIRVTNLLGTAFMKEEVKDPYDSLLDIIEDDDSDVHIIDFHAEATGEKKAFAYSLKNTVGAVIGTHTHVQTNDAQILNTGVAYISDAGMCGSYNSVLGCEVNSVVGKIIFHNEDVRFKLLDEDDSIFNAVVIKFDDLSFKPISIIPINKINKMGE